MTSNFLIDVKKSTNFRQQTFSPDVVTSKFAMAEMELTCRGIYHLFINYILYYKISLTLGSKVCIDKWPLSDGRRQNQADRETCLLFTNFINTFWNIQWL